AAIDLRRDDDVGEVEILVQQAAIPASNVVAESRAATSEYIGGAAKPSQKRSDVVGPAAQKAKNSFSQGGHRQPACPQLVEAARDHERAVGLCAGLWRSELQIASRIGGEVVQARDREADTAERRVLSNVSHALAVHEYGPIVGQ